MASLWRLFGFLRPYRRAAIASLGFAWLAMGVTVLIPLLIGNAVDAISGAELDKEALWPLALAILGAGVLRLGLTVVRRIIAGKVSVAVEFDLRERMYAQLQRLELGFFDTQQTGQLMSRATVDLQSIRFFLGYGLIFLTQNLLTIVLASIVMFAIDPLLAALALAPVPIVVATAARYSRLSRPALQEVQQRLAELTAEAEESISGIRVVKAFAREEHMLRRFQRSVTRVFDQNVYSTRLRAFYNPLMGFLPSISLAVVLFVGGNSVINGNITLGEFTAFYAYVIMLTGPMRMLGTSLGMAQRAAASGNRMFEILDREPRIESEPGAPALPDGRGQVELHDVTLRYGDGSAAGPALESVSMAVEAGTTVALVGPTGSGKTTPGGAARAPLRPDVGLGFDRRRGPARRGRGVGAPLGRVRRRRELPVLGVGRGEHRLRASGGDAGGDRAGRAAGAGAWVHRAAARWLRDGGGRPGADALGRAAPARGDRAGDPRRSAHPDPRRRDVVGRCADRGGDQARACKR